MKWLIFAVQFLSIFGLGFCQDIATLKFNQIEELLSIARSLDKKLQEMKTETASKFQALDDRLTAMEGQILVQLKSHVSPKQDSILQNLELLQEDLSLHTTLLNSTCTQEQMADLQSSIVTEQELPRNIPSEICTKNHLETLQELLATDECTDGSHNCSENAVCRDAFIGYRCSCEDGHQGDGFNCEDVDECESGIHKCDVNGHCQNQIGNYSCICQPGFSGDGFTCEDIDECTTGSHTCSSEAICSNTDGDYDCHCLSGFTGDGFTCEDIDECNTDVSPCNSDADCRNNPGSFNCDCRSGFRGDGISSCEVPPTCVPPSQELGSLGCVTPVTDKGRSWDEAQEYCRTLGGHLLEGITSQEILNQIKQHFKSFYTGNFVWVGFRNLTWTESGSAISTSSSLWYSTEPTKGEEECGSICATCDRPYIADLVCGHPRLALCQSYG